MKERFDLLSGKQQLLSQQEVPKRQAELAFDQKTLVDEWATFALARNPRARMHFGLQNKGEWNAKTIADRYPAGAYASLVGMDALYDPQAITRSAFEASVIDASQVRLPAASH